MSWQDCHVHRSNIARGLGFARPSDEDFLHVRNFARRQIRFAAYVPSQHHRWSVASHVLASTYRPAQPIQ